MKIPCLVRWSSQRTKPPFRLGDFPAMFSRGYFHSQPWRGASAVHPSRTFARAGGPFFVHRSWPIPWHAIAVSSCCTCDFFVGKHMKCCEPWLQACNLRLERLYVDFDCLDDGAAEGPKLEGKPCQKDDRSNVGFLGSFGQIHMKFFTEIRKP